LLHLYIFKIEESSTQAGYVFHSNAPSGFAFGYARPLPYAAAFSATLVTSSPYIF